MIGSPYDGAVPITGLAPGAFTGFQDYHYANPTAAIPPFGAINAGAMTRPGVSYNPDGSIYSTGPSAFAGAPAAVAQANISKQIQDLVNGFNSPTGQGGGAYDSTTGGVRRSGYVPSMNYTGAGRPVGSLNAAPRSASVQAGVADAYKTRQANNATANQSLADWMKEYRASLPKARQFTGEEVGAVSRIYGTGADSVGGNLARIRNNRQTSLRDLTEAAYRRAGRSNNLRRMGSGNSSYLDRLYAQDLGNIAAQGAVQGADQERADSMYLDSQRTGALGSRQQLLDQLLNRQLLPGQVSNQVEAGNNAALGTVAGLDYGNNVYQSDEDAYGRRIDFLNQLMQQGYGGGYG